MFFFIVRDSAANCQMKTQHDGNGTSILFWKMLNERFGGNGKIMAKVIRKMKIKNVKQKKRKRTPTHTRRMQLGIIVIDFSMHIT